MTTTKMSMFSSNSAQVEQISHQASEQNDSKWWQQWDPYNVTLKPDEDDDTYTGPTDAWKTCVLQGVYFGENEYNGWLGARISSVFVILIVSTGFTLFPILAKKNKHLKLHKYVYLFARNFGTGVIVATAFIHLLDPAYEEIGGLSCVGSTGNWSIYAWCPAIVLATVFLTFIIDVAGSVYVENHYGYGRGCSLSGVERAIVRDQNSDPAYVHDIANGENNAEGSTRGSIKDPDQQRVDINSYQGDTDSSIESIRAEMSFKGEFAAFLILEFGILFHSVMIGLNLGSCGEEFRVLYPVLVFHQSFEGLGIGARLSFIDFPKNKRYWPYALCIAYGLTTPIAVAIGLGVRNTYASNSYSVNVVSGVLDAISAGILIYTGLVELLARDYIMNPNRTKDMKELLFDFASIFFGAGLMALLGKWA